MGVVIKCNAKTWHPEAFAVARSKSASSCIVFRIYKISQLNSVQRSDQTGRFRAEVKFKIKT